VNVFDWPTFMFQEAGVIETDGAGFTMMDDVVDCAEVVPRLSVTVTVIDGVPAELGE